ncbi:Uncharacterised protein [Leclercia adecarboxylata]|uniref:Uncharacterized protein n=1 Tax=Leclercia adecarboxylata TaxID=83655 RepID=A0A4U9HEH0_9ENTR|nr:Uncharacterised protein [Leclercia adecarboxylata]
MTKWKERSQSVKIPGRVRHDTFYSLHEVFNKLNSYTSRLVKYQPVRPSLSRGVISAIGAFFKWYLFSGAWRQGASGSGDRPSMPPLTAF